MINNNNRRRSFRPRPQKNNFRRRSSSMNSSNGSSYNNNGNMNFNRNGSMTNPHNVEKTMQKFQQLAKDAQSSGDPVLVENYLQHADHYATPHCVLWYCFAILSFCLAYEKEKKN